MIGPFAAAMGDKESFLVDSSSAPKEKKLMNCKQNVKFIGEAAESHELCCTDVRVVCGQGFHTSGSSKLAYKTLVEYNWEPRYYTGQLIAVHCLGKFYAYGLKTVKSDASSSTGAIRVVSEVSGKRALIRGLKGMVQDLAFSHLREEVILACVDPQGSLFVHSLEEGVSELKCQLILHIEKNYNITSNIVHRVVWCPYIPDGTVDKEVAELLVLTSGQKAEMWCVPMVTAKHGAGPLKPEDVTDGILRVPEFEHSITDAAFSPDGSAIAIATAGGLVSFFQVYMHNKATPRCLHSWTPHNDQPLSTLLFLDNHQEHSPEVQFWKWALTGAKDNTEIKLWACETWNCLQTIKFEPGPNRSLPTPNKLVLKAAIDLSSKYLVLSDINSRMLYVLQLQMENGPAHVSLVSGFNMHHPAISFAIVEAGIKAQKLALRRGDIHTIHDSEDDDDEDEGSNRNASCVVLKMFIVGPKSLQECELAFEPIAEPPTISHDTIEFPEVPLAVEGAEDTMIVTSTDNSAVGGTNLADSLNITSGSNLNLSSSSLNLMTPEAFTSPATRQEDNPSVASTLSTGSTKKISTTPPVQDVSAILTQLSQITVEEKAHSVEESIMSRGREGGMASGGSSPSREVQQILSHDKDGSLSDDFYEAKEDQQDTTIEDIAAKIKEEPVELTESYSWPQIPQVIEIEAMAEMAAAVPKIEQIIVEEFPLSVELPPSIVQPVPLAVVDHSAEVVEELKSLKRCVQALTTIIEEQQGQIKDLQTQVLRTVPRKDVLENAATVALEKALSRQLSRQSQAIESQIKLKMSDMENGLSNNLTNAIDMQVSSKMQKLFETEIQKLILPTVIHNMELIKGLVHTEINQKMQSTDRIMQENVNRLVHSKQLQDSLSASLAASLQMSMASCFREVLLATVVPTFEKTCKTLFTQLNDSFSQGTSEHLAAVEAQLEKQRLRQQERTRETNTQIAALGDSFRIGHDATAAMVRTELHTTMSNAIMSLQENVGRVSREAVTEAVGRALREHSSNLHSRPETPQSRIDPQAQLATVLNLVHQGKFNEAFQQALSASDLLLVVKLCEQVNPQKLFGQSNNCPLHQPVLLSLIQQLSADLNSKTDLKVRYLEEAVVNLESDNDHTKQYIPNIVIALQKQLNSFISCHPNEKIVRSMKMLLLATQALISPQKY